MVMLNSLLVEYRSGCGTCFCSHWNIWLNTNQCLVSECLFSALISSHSSVSVTVCLGYLAC